MDEFNRQLQNNLQSSINEFNNSIEFEKIRELYKLHFDKIDSLIERFGHKLSIEDISIIDKNLTVKIIDNMLLLKEINKAISKQEMTLKDIK